MLTISAKRAWLLFDWAGQPFFTLIATFVFPPFFVTQLVGDPIEGQAVWGVTTAIAALLTAIAAPIIGHLCDRTGRIKTYFFAACLAGAIGVSLIWLCAPENQNALYFGMAATIIGTMGFEIATSTNNAMLKRIATPDEAVRWAWAGWAWGGASGTLTLLFFVACILPTESGRSLLGFGPIFRFLAEPTSAVRFTGPFSALWLLFFIVPLWFVYSDRQSKMQVERETQKAGETTKKRNSFTFLIANMLLSDALVALFVFGGIYAAVVFHWGAAKLGVLGLMLTFSGFCGPLLGLWLHRIAETKRSAIIACGTIVLAGLFILTLTPDFILGWPATIVVPGLTTAELAFAIASFIIGLTSSFLQSALRVMFLEHVTENQSGKQFGWFALSGKSTSFVGPLLVAATITQFESTKAGMLVVLLMFFAGMIVLLRDNKAQ